ncbi:GTP-binding protein gtr2 [Mucor velutinosus]|uniref:Succinate dehydrogenase [ubiquinone] cytochrome b small subunit n=1 Tax=Mucor velutinosus TaxID=708070 RepID=A0AAN7HVV6_9FUNG|nr:GTP-binding protein gtr2 [Mucor velutinosus]
MALRILSRPVGLVHKPALKITPSLLRSSYSAAASTNNNDKASKPTDTSTTAESATSTNTATPATEKDDVVKSEKVEELQEDGKKKKKVKVEEPEEGYAYGAHHWNMERGSAITLIPLVSTQLIYGAHPIVDGLLGVVLPYHIYMGFDSCITDYIPKRVYPRLHKVANWTLTGTTGLVMWGCYEFNTNDIGITEFMQRLFAA